ncbi:TPA: NnrS family protein [Burkholderia vietnamiensis]|uniref:NnrS family protein n=1 Tax=Burkholderia vietnamiensis TaxID=60552 RepID=UPI00075CBC0A|nr:NnrS family protein [Burkholderia vietnamiensis]KVR98326.1 NnrS family protein [Burkholderia vietnamiensis]HDR9046199.1 NnrS family protein [Burkholderia vietnamiensis]HDR9236116.1 NnrS family protein [Burkholderia vietnamiensis]
MKISEPMQAPSAPATPPLLQLGLRPFYLTGAGFASIAVAVWLAAWHGVPAAGRAGAMTGLMWHVHEMIFGFVAAIVVGFLLTATRAWTSRETLRGPALGVLWLLWLAGRVLVWSGPAVPAAIVDALFLPVTAAVLLRVLLAAKNRHNVFLPVALLLFGALNVLFHVAVTTGRADLALRAAYAATGLVVFFVAVITGRIVPMFTMNAIPGFTMRRFRLVDTLAGPAVALTLFADALGAPGALLIAAALATAVLHAWRIVGWRSWRVGKRPIVWILHVSCLWIPIGFVLLALSVAGVVAHSLAVHALTVGAIGGAIVAMITRTALGHTGRMLVAGPWEQLCYWLVIVAAVLRVFGPLVPGVGYVVWLDASAACWIVAFAAYAVHYAPILMSPRADGRRD